MPSPDDSSQIPQPVCYRLFVTALVLFTVFSLCSTKSIAQKTPYTDPFDVKTSQEFSEVAQALEIDHYNLALELLSKLRSNAVKVKDETLFQEVFEATNTVKRLKREFAKVRHYSEIVKKKTNDPEAYKKVGIFYCAEKNDWGKGLLLLTKSEDPELQQTAQEDLEQPESPSQQAKLADAWWNLAEQEKGQIRKAYQLRGRYWYLQARPDLTVAERAEREKQLQEIALEADKIVIWNQHAGKRADRGTNECMVTLLYKNKAVWSQKVQLPWKPDAPAGTAVRPPHVRFDQIRVDITKYRNFGGGLGEIEVFDGAINVARGCSAIAQSYWRQSSGVHPNNVTNGDKTGDTGTWVLDDRQTGWILVDMVNFLQQQ